MKVGYIRISTKEQNTARQDELMKKLGVEKVYTDKMSGILSTIGGFIACCNEFTVKKHRGAMGSACQHI